MLYRYRSLLDAWKLWTQRAMFDVEYGQYQTGGKQPKQQVFVSCNFCGKSISVYMQGMCRTRGAFARLGSTSNKLKVSNTGHLHKVH